MVISLLVYLIFNKSLPTVSKVVSTNNQPSSLNLKNNMGAVVLAIVLVIAVVGLFHIADMYTEIKDISYKLGLAVGLFVGFVTLIFKISTKEEFPRIVALTLVFIVVIFFWMSFHQNGLTMNIFARDYTVKEVGHLTFLLFNLDSILCVIATIVGVILAIRKGKMLTRLLAGLVTVVAGIGCWFLLQNYEEYI